MANRHTLAVNKLEDFKQWLIDNDWKIEHTKGNYEVLRARKETEKLPIIVYKKDKEGLIHLSVSDWNLKYVEQFINSKKQKVETAWVPFRNNNRISQFICETKEDCQNKINYWFGKDENVIPTKVEIKVAEDVKD